MKYSAILAAFGSVALAVAVEKRANQDAVSVVVDTVASLDKSLEAKYNIIQCTSRGSLNDDNTNNKKRNVARANGNTNSNPESAENRKDEATIEDNLEDIAQNFQDAGSRITAATTNAPCGLDDASSNLSQKDIDALTGATIEVSQIISDFDDTIDVTEAELPASIQNDIQNEVDDAEDSLSPFVTPFIQYVNAVIDNANDFDGSSNLRNNRFDKRAGTNNGNTNVDVSKLISARDELLDTIRDSNADFCNGDNSRFNPTCQ